MQPIFMNIADSCYTLPQYNITPMLGGGMFPSVFTCQLNPYLFAQNAFKFGNIGFGGNGIFSGFGAPVNMGCNFWNPFAQLGGGVSTSTSSSSSSTSNVGKDKYEALKKLLDSFAAYRLQSSDESYKDEISKIAKSKDSYTTKYEKLKEIYDEISSSDQYETFLREKASSIRLSNGESLENALIEIGYVELEGADTYAEKIIDGEFNALAKDICEKKDNNVINVINVIRDYNTKDNMNFISKLAEKYNSANGDDKTQYEAVINQVASKLVQEAKNAADNLETDNKFYDKLSKMAKSSNGRITEEFIKEFNKVYAYTRVLKAKALDRMYAKTFSIGETTKYTDDTVKALKKEKGIEAKYVDEADKLAVKYGASLSKSQTTSAKSVKDYQKNNDAQGAIDIMVDKNDVLAPVEEEITVIGSDGKENKYEKRYKVSYGNSKSNYIVVKTDNGTEIHRIEKQGNKWKDVETVGDWQRLNVDLVDAKKAAAITREDNDKKAQEAEDKKEPERRLMRAAFGSFAEAGTIKINNVSYNVYVVEPKSSIERMANAKTGGKSLYYIKNNKIYKIWCQTGGVTLSKDGSIKAAPNTKLFDESMREYKDPQAKSVAKYIRAQLRRHTSDEEWKNFRKLLNNDAKTIKDAGGRLTEENIMYMIAYYNSEYRTKLFEHIMDEDENDSAEMCMKLVNLVLKYVENHGGKNALNSTDAKNSYEALKNLKIENIGVDVTGEDIDEYLSDLINFYYPKGVK